MTNPQLATALLALQHRLRGSTVNDVQHLKSGVQRKIVRLITPEERALLSLAADRLPKDT